MFDIGFTELALCLVVALVVIGPEQLPGTVRTIGLWIGRLKRSLRDTRAEIERQIGADDIRRQLHNEDILRSIEETRQAMENSIMDEGQTPEPRRNYGPPEELPDHAHMDEHPTGDNQTSDQHINKAPSAESAPEQLAESATAAAPEPAATAASDTHKS